MLLFCIMLPMTSFAYIGTYEKGKLQTYSQGTKNGSLWGNLSLCDGTPVSQAGCGWFSTYFLLVASKVWDPSKKTPGDLIEAANQNNYSRSGQHYFDQEKIDEASGGRIELASDSPKWTSASIDSANTVIQDGMLNKGYFCYICFARSDGSGHYVYIDNPNNGDWIIGDSGWANSIKWSDIKGQGANGSFTEVNQIYFFKVKDSNGKQIKWSEDYSLYSSDFLKSYLDPNRKTVKGTGESNDETKDDSSQNGGSTLTPQESQDLSEGAALIMNEWELEGMPEKGKLVESRLDFTITDEDALGALGEDNVRVIGENIEARNKLTIPSLLHIILSVAGFILVIYGTLLILAYLFDLAYIGKRLSLLNIITFGKAAPQSRKDDVNAKKYLTGKGVIIRSVIIWICGLLLIRGNILLFVREILDFINSKIG